MGWRALYHRHTYLHLAYHHVCLGDLLCLLMLCCLHWKQSSVPPFLHCSLAVLHSDCHIWLWRQGRVCRDRLRNLHCYVYLRIFVKLVRSLVRRVWCTMLLTFPIHMLWLSAVPCYSLLVRRIPLFISRSLSSIRLRCRVGYGRRHLQSPSHRARLTRWSVSLKPQYVIGCPLYDTSILWPATVICDGMHLGSVIKASRMS